MVEGGAVLEFAVLEVGGLEVDLVEFGFVEEDGAAKSGALVEAAAAEGGDRTKPCLRPVAGLVEFCVGCVEPIEEEGVGEVGGAEELGVIEPETPSQDGVLLGEFVAGGDE